MTRVIQPKMAMPATITLRQGARIIRGGGGGMIFWPSKKETWQVTGVVFLFVGVLALFMWAVDSGLAWLLYDIVLGRGK